MFFTKYFIASKVILMSMCLIEPFGGMCLSESVKFPKKEAERNRFKDLTIRVRDFAKSFVDTFHEPFLLLDNDKRLQ
ncbi:hypothetical protein METP1_00790 [Methanosarcinales archaeon]|nr:hypothetical protein METP1_00790 [Methanosarcinales archaeon]